MKSSRVHTAAAVQAYCNALAHVLKLQTSCHCNRHSHSVTVQDLEDANGPTEGWALEDDLAEQNAALKATVADCRSKLSQADAQAS